jgi:putative transposase
MDERVRFIGDVGRGDWTFASLCEHYGISRKTGYKWLDRYEAEGPSGLEERSRRPLSCPHETPSEAVVALVELRRLHPTWGAKKLLTVLRRRRPKLMLPARSTACDLLKRAGLVPAQRRRRKLGHPGRPMSTMDQPNAVWTADFKGEFKTRDGYYCYPLTVADGYSRYLLACQGLRTTAVRPSKVVFKRLFEEYGLPQIIRTDNGVPFATTALGRLSNLSAWWIRLGISPELIEPGHPDQNGRHERMHKTLKAEATRPPSGSLPAQQVRFNRFRREFNEDRPHEALGQDTPSSWYHRSRRQLPRKLSPFDYPAHYEVRLVSTNGGLRWRCRRVNVTTTLMGEYVGLEEVGDGLWDVYFCHVRLGRLDERRMRIEDEPGRWIRGKQPTEVSPMSLD